MQYLFSLEQRHKQVEVWDVEINPFTDVDSRPEHHDIFFVQMFFNVRMFCIERTAQPSLEFTLR